MGITIHYRGSINSKGLINSFIDEVSDICDSMSWDYNVLNEDWNVPTDLSVAYEDEGVTSRHEEIEMLGRWRERESICKSLGNEQSKSASNF